MQSLTAKRYTLVVFIQIGTLPHSADIQQVAGRLHDNAQDRAPTDRQADHYREFAVARNELLGAVHRIDNPDTLLIEPQQIVL